MMQPYQDTWTCQTCHSPVSLDTYPCPNCLINDNKPHPRQKGGKNKCFVCTFENPEFVSHCQACQTALGLIPIQLPKKHSATIICKSCKQQNNINNIECVFCENDLYDQPKKECPICQSKVKEMLYDQHYHNCLLTREILEEEEGEQRKRQEQELKKLQMESMKNLEECIHCRQKLMPNESAQHTAACRTKAMKNLVFDSKTRTTPLQSDAISYMHRKSQKQHNSVKVALQQRIKKLGYTIQDLNNLQFYIQNYAPIIIHMHVTKHMQFFVKDTHYRSQFETNQSSGSLSRSSRTGWEDRMFDKKYSKATDFQRVKYGVINFTNDPKGVNVCVGYGKSYFLLKQHVRERCTFTDKDSSNADSAIATFKYCFKILSKMNDNELKAAFDASKAKEVSSGCTVTYKEMQVHGPIEFSKDIERIYVNKEEVKTDKKLLEMVYQFSKKNGIDHDFF